MRVAFALNVANEKSDSRVRTGGAVSLDEGIQGYRDKRSSGGGSYGIYGNREVY